MTPSFGLGFLYMFVAAFGYGTVALFGKWIFLHELPMYTLLTWRFGGAALLFALLTRFDKSSSVPISWKLKGACFLLGLCGDLLQTTLFFFAVGAVGASLSALLLYTFPLFVFLLQRFLFKQRASLIQWLSLSTALLGIFLVFPMDSFALNAKGILYGLGTAVAYATYLCYGAHFTQSLPTPLASTYLTAGACTGFLLLSLALQDTPPLPMTSMEWITILGMVLIATVIPLFCLLRGMQLLGAVQSSLLFTLEPVITILFATLLFSEPFTLRIGAGGTLILLSTLTLRQKNNSRSKTKRVL